MTDSLTQQVRETLREWKKSSLQLELEADGWIFLTNHRKSYRNLDEMPLSLSELKTQLKQRYQEVRFECSYDINANPLSIGDMIAIYVR